MNTGVSSYINHSIVMTQWNHECRRINAINRTRLAYLPDVMGIRKIRLKACRYHGIHCLSDRCAVASGSVP
jgi:hypothetical protein